MASPKQIELFRRLTEDRDLGDVAQMPALREQFGSLTDRNASVWIERGLEKPRRSDAEQDAASVAPPF